MVFKRRDRRTILRLVQELVYPRGGWTRAFEYLKHRLRRLPDTPQKIGRGIWAGVFVCFTPIFGLHFVAAALIARVMRGNIVAALMATFFGNPLTFPPIGLVSIYLGSWILGISESRTDRLGQQFADAGIILWQNFLALFTDAEMKWRGLQVFYDQVFFPYLIGGLLPGIVTATIIYWISVPVIGAYQTRRKRLLRAKLDQLNKKPSSEGETSP